MLDLDPGFDWQILDAGDFTAHMGRMAHAQTGEAEWRFCLDIAPHHLNVGGVVHGGVSLTLLDSGMGRGAWMAAGKKPCATIQLDSHFLAAAKLGQRIDGTARLLRRTADLAFMEGELSAGGRPTMRASGVWKYLNVGR